MESLSHIERLVKEEEEREEEAGSPSVQQQKRQRTSSVSPESSSLSKNIFLGSKEHLQYVRPPDGMQRNCKLCSVLYLKDKNNNARKKKLHKIRTPVMICSTVVAKFIFLRIALKSIILKRNK